MDKKKLLFLGVGIALLLGAWWYFFKPAIQPSTETVSLYFEPSSFSVKPGDSFNVPLKLNPDGKQITAQELYFSFDKDLLVLNSIATSSAFAAVLMPTKIDNDAGQASIIIGVPPTSPVSEITDVLYFNFSAKEKTGIAMVRVENHSQAAAIGMSANVLSGFGSLKLEIKE